MASLPGGGAARVARPEARDPRREKGWSQDELAQHAQIVGRQISRYGNDRVTPSIEVVIKMAKAYNVSLDYLLSKTPPAGPSSCR